jgi:hypothetical protein
VFLDAATVRGLLPELEMEGSGCTFSSVVALSYAWVTPADPDPQRAQLHALRPVLVWWMCERAKRKLGRRTWGEGRTMARTGPWEGGDATMQTADFGVFIDFMSMFQPDDSTGTKPAYTKPAEQASFRRALRNIGLLYGHGGTVVFKMTETPLPADGDPDRVYGRRGWCHLERRLGDLEAPASNSLDVAAWPTAEAERAAREKPTEYGGDLAAQRGPPQLRESEEELAAQGDHAFASEPGTLGALIRDGGRGAPVSPEHFEEELKEKVFSFDSDRTVCAGLYRGVAEPLLAAVEELDFGSLEGWTAADWRHMGGALACCTKLRRLYLTGMGADDAAMAAFGGALGSGAAPALKTLELIANEIGDEGLRQLGDAFARGAAPALKTLYLNDNKIGDEGVRHLGDALARGAAPVLQTLYLHDNAASAAAMQAAEKARGDRMLDGAFLVAHFADTKELDCMDLGWGDEEARRLAAALEHAHSQGALKALEKLDLNWNEIGDEGMRHLGDALARSAAPAIKAVGLKGNPASAAAQQAVQDALKQRASRE